MGLCKLFSNNCLQSKFLSQSHLAKVKAFEIDAVSSGNVLFEDVKKSATSLKEVLSDIGSDDKTFNMIQLRVTVLQERLDFVIKLANELSSSLLADHMQSLGPETGLEDLLSWISDVESSLSSMKPISLNDEELQQQISDILLFQSDLDSHLSSIQTVASSVKECIKSQKEKQHMEEKLIDLKERFDNAREVCHLRNLDVRLISGQLGEFKYALKKFNDWVIPMQATLLSPSLSQLSTIAFQEKARHFIYNFRLFRNSNINLWYNNLCL